MAVIVITADTESKVLSVTIDGITIPDIEDACVYTYHNNDGTVNELSVNVSSVSKTENGITRRVSYYAYGSKKAQSAIASGQTVYTDVKGFVGIEDICQAASDIDEYLSSQKRAL